MDGEEYEGMPQLPCSRGEVDGLQSRKHKICVASRVIADWLQMTCSKCKQHFCYRCGSKLQASNPYEHFSRPGGGCYYKLFDVAETRWEEPMAMDEFVWV